jgi:hypothetical protein
LGVHRPTVAAPLFPVVTLRLDVTLAQIPVLDVLLPFRKKEEQ